MNLNTSLLLLAILLGAGTAYAETGKVYMWIDDQGVRHFSASPPLAPQDNLTERTFSDPEASGAESSTQDPDVPVPGSEREMRCLNAIHHVESLQRRPVVGVRRPGVSEPVLLTGASLQEVLRRAQRAVEYECGTRPESVE